MATGSVLLMPGAAVTPDGSTNNVGAATSRRQGTQATRKAHFLTLDFDGAGSTVESAHWQFPMPANYASGGTLVLLGMMNATANAAKMQAQVAATTAADTDTPLEHAYAAAASVTISANGTEARRLVTGSITLTMDSAAAGDFLQIVVFRDPADAADTATVDFELVSAAFEFVTS